MHHGGFKMESSIQSFTFFIEIGLLFLKDYFYSSLFIEMWFSNDFDNTLCLLKRSFDHSYKAKQIKNCRCFDLKFFDMQFDCIFQQETYLYFIKINAKSN